MKFTPVQLDRLDANWFGFATTAHKPKVAGTDYAAIAPATGGHWRAELADCSPPDDWAQFSIEQRRHIATDDLERLGDLVRAEVAGFLESVVDPDAARWLYGCETTDRNVVGAVLAEFVIHGQDLGRLTGNRPTLTTAQAAAALPNTMAIVSAFVDRERARRIAGTYHLGFRGHGDWTFRISGDGELVAEAGRPERADARMSADPAAFLLTSLGRVNQVVPALTGRIVAYGRKPWRLLALGNLAVDGV